MTVRIGFSGCPGTGKSSLASSLRGDLKSVGTPRKVELVTEYARRHINKYGLPESVAEQQRMLRKQADWEDCACTDKIDIVFSDCPIFLGFMYALQMRDLTSFKDTMFLNDLFKEMNKLNCPPRYKIIFHLPPVKNPMDDGIRTAEQLTEEWRGEADALIRFVFKLFPPEHFIVLKEIDFYKQMEECKGHLSRLGVLGESEPDTSEVIGCLTEIKEGGFWEIKRGGFFNGR